MTTYLLRRVDPGFAEIILAANGRANAYELTFAQVLALAAQAVDIVASWPKIDAEELKTAQDHKIDLTK